MAEYAGGSFEPVPAAESVRPCYDCGNAWDGYAIWPERQRPPTSGAGMVYLCRPCCDRRGLRLNDGGDA